MKDLSRKALMLWDSSDDEDPREIFAVDYVNHQEPDAEGGVTHNGLDDYVHIVQGHRKAFGWSEVTILMQVAEKDLVATRWRFDVTHTGDYLGHAATGRDVWTGIQIDRHKDGRNVESWVDWDKFRMLQSLGFIDAE